MKHGTYKLEWVLRDVAEALRDSTDHGETTIRCTINDTLDHAERDGYTVRHDYNQQRAVARVKELIMQAQVKAWEQHVRDNPPKRVF